MFTISQELEIFLWSVMCGSIIMFLHDVLSLAWKSGGFSILVCNICDGIFVICASSFMIFVVFCVSNGYIRAYEFIGVAIGGFLYEILLGNFLSFVMQKVLFFIYVFFTKIFKLLLTPIRFMYKIICSIIGLLYRLAFRFFAPLKNKCTARLHTFCKTFKKT